MSLSPTQFRVVLGTAVPLTRNADLAPTPMRTQKRNFWTTATTCSGPWRPRAILRRPSSISGAATIPKQAIRFTISWIRTGTRVSSWTYTKTSPRWPANGLPCCKAPIFSFWTAPSRRRLRLSGFGRCALSIRPAGPGIFCWAALNGSTGSGWRLHRQTFVRPNPQPNHFSGYGAIL